MTCRNLELTIFLSQNVKTLLMLKVFSEPTLLPTKGTEGFIYYQLCYRLCEHMFTPDRELKDLIIEYLKKEEQSISSLHRKLKEDGYKLHRLVLTGYLKALTDTMILKEKDIPPSKVYSTTSHYEKGLYEVVGEKCASHASSDAEKILLAVYALQKLFHRPIFLEEIRKLGLEGPIEIDKIGAEERAEARKVLSRANFKIPYNDPAYLVREDYSDKYHEVLEDILVEKFKVGKLLRETKQLKLQGL